MSEPKVTYECTVCGWVYDETTGDPASGVPSDTKWEELPDDWACPVCDAGRDEFEIIEAAAPAEGPTPEAPPVVIVGSGLAGYTLARELRKRSAELSITIVAADGGEIYTKPMLSNALAKHHTPDALVQKTAAAFAEDAGVTILSRTRVLSIDRANRTVATDGGGSIAYDRLVLALGADARVFPAPGSDAVGIATVNDLDDYRVWRNRIKFGDRILLIGAGLIGCEFANDLAGVGFGVTVIDPAEWPLSRLLPEEVGTMLTEALEKVGVTFRLGRTVARYEAADVGFSATLSDGSSVGFDHALSAVGLAPRTKLAKDAGLQVRAGVVVDSVLCTSDPHVYALGDCAETKAGVLPFIAPLLAEARVLAATLTGEETPLHLPALPVLVKTPALPLVICPPKPGAEGAWTVERTGTGAAAVFRTPQGEDIGFALAGTATGSQQDMAKRMPALLPPETPTVKPGAGATAGTWVCDTCGWVYDPRVGDPDGGIAPGTAWEDIPDNWECPTCGVGKDNFRKVA